MHLQRSKDTSAFTGHKGKRSRIKVTPTLIISISSAPSNRERHSWWLITRTQTPTRFYQPPSLTQNSLSLFTNCVRLCAKHLRCVTAACNSRSHYSRLLARRWTWNQLPEQRGSIVSEKSVCWHPCMSLASVRASHTRGASLIGVHPQVVRRNRLFIDAQFNSEQLSSDRMPTVGRIVEWQLKVVVNANREASLSPSCEKSAPAKRRSRQERIETVRFPSDFDRNGTVEMPHASRLRYVDRECKCKYIRYSRHLFLPEFLIVLY